MSVVTQHRWPLSWRAFGGIAAMSAVTMLLLFLYRRVVFLEPPQQDFINHREWGRRFLAGEFLYDQGLNIPYPPCWALVHAPCAVLPVGLAFVLYSGVGLLCLLWLLYMLRQLSSQRLSGKPLSPGTPGERGWGEGAWRRNFSGFSPLTPDPVACGAPPSTGERGAFRIASQRVDLSGGMTTFWLVAAVLIVVRPFLLRDFQDGGANLMLVALAWSGVYYWARGREWLGGLCLGLATALKCTSGLFLLYFAWRRQWKMLATATLALAFFTLAPALWQGPSFYLLHMWTWTEHLRQGLFRDDPTVGILGPDDLRNKALKPMLARLLVELPDEHPAHFRHSWHVQPCRLSSHSARVVIHALLASLLIGVAWRFAVATNVDPHWECAAVSLLMLLCSPITWGQHCVGTIPAFYLLFRSAGGLKRWQGFALAGLAFFNVIVLNRTLVHGNMAALLDSYGLFTWSLLLLLALCLTPPLRLPERA